MPLPSILRLNADRGRDPDTVVPGYITQAHKGLDHILANSVEKPSESAGGDAFDRSIRMRCDQF